MQEESPTKKQSIQFLSLDQIILMLTPKQSQGESWSLGSRIQLPSLNSDDCLKIIGSLENMKNQSDKDIQQSIMWEKALSILSLIDQCSSPKIHQDQSLPVQIRNIVTFYNNNSHFIHNENDKRCFWEKLENFIQRTSIYRAQYTKLQKIKFHFKAMLIPTLYKQYDSLSQQYQDILGKAQNVINRKAKQICQLLRQKEYPVYNLQTLCQLIQSAKSQLYSQLLMDYIQKLKPTDFIQSKQTQKEQIMGALLLKIRQWLNVPNNELSISQYVKNLKNIQKDHDKIIFKNNQLSKYEESIKSIAEIVGSIHCNDLIKNKVKILVKYQQCIQKQTDMVMSDKYLVDSKLSEYYQKIHEQQASLQQKLQQKDITQIVQIQEAMLSCRNDMMGYLIKKVGESRKGIIDKITEVVRQGLDCEVVEQGPDGEVGSQMRSNDQQIWREIEKIRQKLVEKNRQIQLRAKQLDNVQISIKEMEEQNARLKQQASQIQGLKERFKELEQQNCEIQRLHIQRSQLEKKNKESNSSIAELQKWKERKEQDCWRYKETIKNLKKNQGMDKQELIQQNLRVNQQIQQLKGDLTQRQNNPVALQSKGINTEQDYEIMKRQNQQLKSQKNDQQLNIEKLKQELEQSKIKEPANARPLETNQLPFVGVKTQIHRKQQYQQTITSHQQSAMQTQSTSEHNNNKIQEQLEQLKREYDERIEEIHQLKANIRTFKQNKQQKKKEVNWEQTQLQSNYNQLQQKVIKLTMQNDLQKREISEKQSKIKKLQIQIEEMTNKIQENEVIDACRSHNMYRHLSTNRIKKEKSRPKSRPKQLRMALKEKKKDLSQVRLQPICISTQIYQLQKITMQTQSQKIHQCFHGKIRLSFEHKQLIFSEILKSYSGNSYGQIDYEISGTQILYMHPQMKKLNFHDYVDEIENILIVVQLKNTHSFVVVYSEPMTSKTEMINLYKKGAFFAVLPHQDPLKNPTIFYLKKMANVRVLPYNEYYLMVGNSELRIKRGEDRAETNIPTVYQYFDMKGEKDAFFMFESHQKQVQIERYDIYRVNWRNKE